MLINNMRKWIIQNNYYIIEPTLNLRQRQFKRRWGQLDISSFLIESLNITSKLKIPYEWLIVSIDIIQIRINFLLPEAMESWQLMRLIKTISVVNSMMCSSIWNAMSSVLCKSNSLHCRYICIFGTALSTAKTLGKKNVRTSNWNLVNKSSKGHKIRSCHLPELKLASEVKS